MLSVVNTELESDIAPQIIAEITGIIAPKVKNWIISVKVTALIPPNVEYRMIMLALNRVA